MDFWLQPLELGCSLATAINDLKEWGFQDISGSGNKTRPELASLVAWHPKGPYGGSITIYCNFLRDSLVDMVIEPGSKSDLNKRPDEERPSWDPTVAALIEADLVEQHGEGDQSDSGRAWTLGEGAKREQISFSKGPDSSSTLLFRSLEGWESLLATCTPGHESR
jgi:hypothetical protein